MRAGIVVCILLILPLPALAQGEPVSGGLSKAGTFFVAPGFLYDLGDGVGDSTLHLGFGAEFIWPRGLGIAADLGYISTTRNYANGVAMFSPGVIYEFRSGESTRPYVRGGYTLIFRDFAENLAHVGFGVNHQFDDTWGFKFEVRNLMFFDDPSINNLEFMLGLHIFL